MTVLDRFSSPLHSERVDPYQLEQAMADQTELIKLNMVDAFICNYWDNTGLVPSAELIQERLYHLDIDLDVIEERIRRF